MADDRSILFETLRKDFLYNTFTEGTYKALSRLIEIEHETGVSILETLSKPTKIARETVTGQAAVYTGVASGGGITSLSKVGAGWPVNGFSTNRAVVITSGTGSGQCRKIVSNTSQELAISGSFDTIPDNTSNFKIIYCYEIATTKVNTIFSLDLTNNYDVAIILPSVASVDEGIFVKIYVEKQGTSAKCYNVCKDGNTQQGYQQGEVAFNKESVTLYTHRYLTNHWDILEIAYIFRIASTYISTPVVSPVAGHLTYAPVAGTWSLDTDVSRRFSLVTVGGSQWLQYDSIIPVILQMHGRITISPDATGAQRIDLTFRYYNKALNTTTDLTTIEASVDFSSTSDYRPIQVFKSIVFNNLDRIQLVDKNSTTARSFTPVKGVIEIV